MALKLFSINHADIEYNKNIAYLNSIGLNTSIKNSVYIPNDFRIDNINNLLYLNKENNSIEYIVFNKHNTKMEITSYFYHYKNNDITPCMGATRYLFDDLDNEFETYFNFFKTTKEDFFRKKLHLKFIKNKCTNYFITYISDKDNNKSYQFSLLNCCKEDGNTKINSMLTKGYHYDRNMFNASLIEVANVLLDYAESIIPNNEIESEKTYQLD